MVREKLNLPDPNEDWECGCVKSHFLDSGAFTIWTKAAEYAKENKTDQWAYYDTPDFYEYLDSYAAFVQKFHYAIDHYANVDAIPNPELTYRNQKYLEQTHGLNPVPVVHYRTSLDWLKRYVDEGYDFIALGGLVGSLTQEHCRGWLDRCFDFLCDNPSRCPRVRIHGFGVTSYELLLRYPWYSVDSTSWTKIGAFGGISVPHQRRGEFVFTEQPYILGVSIDSPKRRERGYHYFTLSSGEKAIVRKWLSDIGVGLGKWKWNPDGTYEVLEYGVVTRHVERRYANLMFYQRMVESMPAYPFPFHLKNRVSIKGFGLI